MIVFERLWRNKATKFDAAIGELVNGALFFAMRSCEYSTVTGERKTKLLTINDIRFFKNRKRMGNSNRNLHTADTVSITFRFQKNKHKDETITQYRSGLTPCPVKAWAAIVTRVLSYPGTTGNSTVNTFKSGHRLLRIPSKDILQKIRATVTAIGSDILGFKAHEVGTHSVRSSCAMALYLAKALVVTIMHVGRWSSDAFLLYIRRQVQEFSKDLTSHMVNSAQFFTIPDETEEELDFETHDFYDPRTQNPNSLASLIRLSGPNGSAPRAPATAFHVWG